MAERSPKLPDSDVAGLRVVRLFAKLGDDLSPAGQMPVAGIFEAA